MDELKETGMRETAVAVMYSLKKKICVVASSQGLVSSAVPCLPSNGDK